MAAEVYWVTADSNGKASVLMMPYTDSPSTLAYAAFGEVARLKHECPACSVATQKIGLASASQVPSQTSAALLSHPNTQYVLPEFDALDQAVGQGIQQAGFTHKVKVATSAGDLPALQQIKAGTFVGRHAGEDFPYEGWANADEAMRMMLGKPIVHRESPRCGCHGGHVGPWPSHPGGPGLGPGGTAQTAYTKMFEKLWGVR